jgi:hypothetical protein
MRADDDQQNVGAGAARGDGRAAGGVSEHSTLLYARTMKRMLHHYICSARTISREPMQKMR